MSTIYKYELTLGENLLDLPTEFKVVHFAAQGRQLYAWIMLDPLFRPIYPQRFVVIGTGHPVPPVTIHRGTCLDGEYVWHLFQEI